MATSYRTNPEQALKSAVLRTLPNVAPTEISVTTATATATDALKPFGGRTVWLVAYGGNITVRRGSHTMIAGKGLVIPNGQWIEVYVDASDSSSSISHIGSASCTLLIESDSEGP